MIAEALPSSRPIAAPNEKKLRRAASGVNGSLQAVASANERATLGTQSDVQERPTAEHPAVEQGPEGDPEASACGRLAVLPQDYSD
jgi:hypothetical protein